MVKLSPELIERCAQYTNPVRDRELDIRGYKIPVIENLGATLDQFDTFDLSDNEIRKLDGFPFLRRLKNLMLSNNKIARIAEHLEESLPNLDTLVLTNNNLQELGDVDPLSTMQSLRVLSLLRNPVAAKSHYRLYVVHKLPQLRLLDFKKIKLAEREEAKKMFKGKKGQLLSKDIGKRSKTFVPGEGIGGPAGKTVAPTQEDIEAIKAAIASAATLEEVERLHQMLQAGQVPGKVANGKSTAGGAAAANNRMEEVEDEDMEAQA